MLVLAVQRLGNQRRQGDVIERIFDFMARVPANTAKGINYVLPLQAVVDLAGKYRMGVAAAKLQATIEKQIGAANKADERVDATLRLWSVAKSNLKLKEAFDRRCIEALSKV